MEFDDIQERLNSLKTSPFRAKFKLSQSDKKLIENKGMATIEIHIRDFIITRLAPAYIKNDGKQTPFKGHPAFVAQHATATCCRGCMFKWHKIPKGIQLNAKQQNYIADVITAWINRNL